MASEKGEGDVIQFHDFGIDVQTYMERGKENNFPLLKQCPHCRAKRPLHRHGYYERNAMMNYWKGNGQLIHAGVVSHKDIKKLTGTDGIWQLRINGHRMLFFYFEGDTLQLWFKYSIK